MKVAFLGPSGTFSEEVLNKIYKKDIKKIPYKTITDVVKALIHNEVDYSVVPIENSTEGCVTETLDTIIENKDIEIKEQYILKIKHNLLAKKQYKLKDIKEIYSHPQALAQCRNFIEENLKDINIYETTSTAESAKIVKEKEYTACIANTTCKEVYNLELLKENIQDNNNNETRFWVLGKNIKNKKENIMTIIFTTKDKPGALYQVLGIFDKYNLNLTKIESRPAKTKLGEYYFWIDIDIKDKSYNKALIELQNSVRLLRILGKY